MRSCTRCRVWSFDDLAIMLLSLSRGSMPGGCALHGSKTRATRLLGSGLADLLLQSLARVAHALVLVRVGRTQGAHIGGDLAHLLPVDAADGEARLLRIDGHVDA